MIPIPSESREGMPNGVLVYFNQETSEWVMSVNRFVKKQIDEDGVLELVSQAKDFLRMAEEQGHHLGVDPDDEDGIRERLPKVGEEVDGLESLNRVLERGLDEAAEIIPKLWGWLIGIDEDPWEPDES